MRLKSTHLELWATVGPQQFHSIVLFPLRLVMTQIAREGLLPPGNLGRLADGGKGTD